MAPHSGVAESAANQPAWPLFPHVNSPVTPPPNTAPGAPARRPMTLGRHRHPRSGPTSSTVGNEVADPLAVALSYIQNLTDTGKIDRRGLLQLRRYASGRAQCRHAGPATQPARRQAQRHQWSPKPHADAAPVAQPAQPRRKARGIQIRRVLEPVGSGPTACCCSSLLTSLIDWALGGTDSSIDAPAPHALAAQGPRLACRFVHGDLHSVGRDPADRSSHADSLAWRLVEQSAATLGVLPLRERADDVTDRS